MIKDINTDEYSCTLKVVITTDSAEKIWIKTCDAEAPKTFYSKRYARIDGKETFYIGMPLTPKKLRVVVYKDGDSPLNNEGYKVRQIEILPLKFTRDISMSRKTKSFS